MQPLKSIIKTVKKKKKGNTGFYKLIYCFVCGLLKEKIQKIKIVI